MAESKDSIRYGSNKEPSGKSSSSLESSIEFGSSSSVYELLNKKMKDGNKISGGEILTHLFRTENIHNELKTELINLKKDREIFQLNYLSCKESLSLANQKNDFLNDELSLFGSFDKLKSLVQNLGAALLGLLPFIITNLKDENQIFIGILTGFISIILLLLPLFINLKKSK